MIDFIEPTEEEIRRRAQELSLEHGKPGHDIEDWLKAEKEFKNAAIEDFLRRVSAAQRKNGADF